MRWANLNRAKGILSWTICRNLVFLLLLAGAAQILFRETALASSVFICISPGCPKFHYTSAGGPGGATCSGDCICLSSAEGLVILGSIAVSTSWCTSTPVINYANVSPDATFSMMKTHAETTSLATGLEVAWSIGYQGCDPNNLIPTTYQGQDFANCTSPLLAGNCGGLADYINFPSTGCVTGLFFQGPCTRSAAFRSRCEDYDDETCNCLGGGYMSPIVIDIDHSGFSMTDAAGGVVFDMLKDGVPLAISWTAAGSTNSLLVLDRNGNGTIDNGEELFGDITPQPASSSPNGFLALAEYDKSGNGGNGNGRIERQDAIFSQLKLWRDSNHNGISESSELQPLSELLRAIDLDYKESRRTDQYGNKFRYRAKVYDVRGAHAGRWAWDVFLTVQ